MASSRLRPVCAPRAPETFHVNCADPVRRWRWLREKYVAIKVNDSTHHSLENAARSELDILTHIPMTNSEHKGWGFIRHPLDSFTLEHGLAKHLCLVFEALREPLWIYRERFIGDVIPSDVLKILLQMILHGLDYLHSECRVVHTGMSWTIKRSLDVSR